MRHIRLWPAPLAFLLVVSCDKTPTETPAAGSEDVAAGIAAELETAAHGTPFEIADVFFELNTTDRDMGFQVLLDAEGWKHVNLTDPEGNQVFGIHAEGGLGEIGITELRFESEEPSPSEVRARFPAGRYIFRGATVEGERLVSEVSLTQRMLPAPTFTPRNGQLVDKANVVVRWDAPGAEKVEVIIEQDELEHVLDVTVSGSTNRLTVPPQFLRRGREYKIEILSIAESGNRTIAESTFRVRR